MATIHNHASLVPAWFTHNVSITCALIHVHRNVSHISCAVWTMRSQCLTHPLVSFPGHLGMRITATFMAYTIVFSVSHTCACSVSSITHPLVSFPGHLGMRLTHSHSVTHMHTGWWCSLHTCYTHTCTHQWNTCTINETLVPSMVVCQSWSTRLLLCGCRCVSGFIIKGACC